MNTWEAATPEAYPIVAYYVIASSLPIFKQPPRHKEAEEDAPHTVEMFEDYKAAAQDEAAVATDKRMVYMMRLPYTETMLQSRFERGADVPEWFSQ